ncbi:hypothetical protein ACOMHN_034998 [Nucella lapillus]
MGGEAEICAEATVVKVATEASQYQAPHQLLSKILPICSTSPHYLTVDLLPQSNLISCMIPEHRQDHLTSIEYLDNNNIPQTTLSNCARPQQ